MKQVEALIFAGTADGRKLAEYLAWQGAQVLLWSATSYGAELANKIPGLTACYGRLEKSEMESLLRDTGCKLVIDATHPYAGEASANILAACAAADVRRIRLLRPSWERQGDSIHTVESVKEAAAVLARQPGRVLLTIGSKELDAFAGMPALRERLFARVLPTMESLSKCAVVGIAPENVIAMQGPFSHEINVAMIRQLQADWLVSKDSGDVGGFPQKLSAVEETGINMLVVGRPAQEDGLNFRDTQCASLELLGITETTGMVIPSYPRFPLFVDLTDKKAVLVGGGAVSQRRAGTLLIHGALVEVVSPKVTPELSEMATEGKITWTPREYHTGDLRGAALSVAATNNREVNKQVRADARRLGIAHSAADDKGEGDFWFPAMIYGDNLCAGLVSTDGNHRAVKLAAETIRKELNAE